MKLPPGHVAGQGVVRPTGYGGFGERMLRGMGWDKGQGLGRTGDGIKEAIQVKKKEDTVGVGGNTSYDWQDKWWERAFDSAVQTLGSGYDSDSDTSSDDEEESARAAMVAVAAAGVNRDGTKTSASADELRLLAQLSQGGRLAAGRFGGRDAKLARIRAQEAQLATQAAAKLGVSASTAASAGASDRSDTTSEAAVAAGRTSSKRSGGSSRAGCGASKKGSAAQGSGNEVAGGSKREKKQGRKKGRKDGEADVAEAAASKGQQHHGEQQQEGDRERPPAAKRQRIVIERRVAAASLQLTFQPTPTEGWWGAARFISAGCLEGLTQDERQRQRVIFDEDMQANIWTAAQAKKTQGKVGLGQGTGTVKVGGVKWEGKKVTFDDPADPPMAAAAAPAAEEAADGEDGDEAEEQRRSARGRLAAASSSSHLDTLGAGSDSKGIGIQRQPGSQQQQWDSLVKWKKIISAQLAQAPGGQLRMKQLQRQVVAAVLEKHGGIVSSKAGVRAAFLVRLESSSKFVVEGKLVRLRA